MTTLTYYVAQSRDGFIARADHGLDWLRPFETSGEDYGFDSFLAGIDGLVMGRGTYDVVRGFGAWPYAKRPTWVLTHREAPTDAPEGVRFGAFTVADLDAQWRAQNLQRVWLVGGGQTAGALADRLDELLLFTAPVDLGAGLPLFASPADPRTALREVASERHTWPSGMARRVWRR